MKTHSLKKHLVSASLIQALVIGALMAVVGYYTIENDVIARVQKEMIKKLDAARIVYDNNIADIKTALYLSSDTKHLIQSKSLLGLDYVFEVPVSKRDTRIPEPWC